MFLIACLISVLVIIIVVSPLFSNKQLSPLSVGATINSLEKLESMKKEVLVQSVKNEQSLRLNDLSKSEYKHRKNYLENNYIDIVRRIDFIKLRKK